jgi:hypothetical protein
MLQPSLVLKSFVSLMILLLPLLLMVWTNKALRRRMFSFLISVVVHSVFQFSPLRKVSTMSRLLMEIIISEERTLTTYSSITVSRSSRRRPVSIFPATLVPSEDLGLSVSKPRESSLLPASPLLNVRLLLKARTSISRSPEPSSRSFAWNSS